MKHSINKILSHETYTIQKQQNKKQNLYNKTET